MTRSSFAWDLPRNLTIKCSLFYTKFILKNLYLAEISLYKKPLFLRETARGPDFIKTNNFVILLRKMYGGDSLEVPGFSCQLQQVGGIQVQFFFCL